MSSINTQSNKVVSAIISSLEIPDELKKHKLVVGYIKKRVVKILDMSSDEIKNLERKLLEIGIKWIEEHEQSEEKRKCIEAYFQARVKRGIKFKMFEYNYFKGKTAQNRRIIRSLLSVWVNKWNQENIPVNKKYDEESWEIVLDYDWKRTIFSHEINYKSWLWEKLHLTKKEIEEYSLEKIDEKANKLLLLSIDHVLRYFTDRNMLRKGLQDRFRSSYFDIIHARWENQKTFFELIQLYYKLEKERKLAIKMGYKNDSDKVRDLNMAQFEIQRLFWLAVLYNDRERNHEFENLSQDKDYLRKKLKKILAADCTVDWIKVDWTMKDNDCPNTARRMVYITKNPDWTYSISYKKPSSDCFVRTFNSAVMRGKTDYFREKEDMIGITHIALRTTKDPQSSVDKILIRGLSSFSQIMDQKWIVIVLDSEKDMDKLEALLTNELWTRETSWIEEFRYPWKLNHQTSWSYRVKKWIMKIVYKASEVKKWIRELNNHLQVLNREIANSCRPNPDITLAIKEITTLIAYLRTRARQWAYNIEIEVQVFDKDNYIRAEIDSKSPAYHWTYKNYQRTLDVFPVLFPAEIYWENSLRKFMIPIIEKKLNTEWTL